VIDRAKQSLGIGNFAPLILRTVEVILRGVRNIGQCADRRAGSGRSKAAFRVHALDETHCAEKAWTLVRCRFQQKPGDCRCVRYTLVNFSGNDFAATVCQPGWTSVVNTILIGVLSVLVQSCYWLNEYPCAAVPTITLNADGECSVSKSVTWFYLNGAADGRQVRSIVVVER